MPREHSPGYILQRLRIYHGRSSWRVPQFRASIRIALFVFAQADVIEFLLVREPRGCVPTSTSMNLAHRTTNIRTAMQRLELGRAINESGYRFAVILKHQEFRQRKN